MAKIDVTKIEGFDGMSAEEKLNALLGYEIPEAVEPKETESEKHLKELLNKANSQAAEYKRQLREKQDKQEADAAERAEKEAELQERLAAYEEREMVSTYKDRYLSIGFDNETATQLAKSTPKGVGEEFFESQKRFLDQRLNEMETKLLQNQPAPTPGKPLGKEDVGESEMNNFLRLAGVHK